MMGDDDSNETFKNKLALKSFYASIWEKAKVNNAKYIIYYSSGSTKNATCM